MEQTSRVVSALLDTFFPALPTEAEKARQRGDESLARIFEFHDERFTRGIVKEVLDLSQKHLPKDAWKALQQLLYILQWRLGTLLLGGRLAFTSAFPYVEPFAGLSLEQRTSILKSWEASSNAELQAAYKSLKGLVCFVLFTAHDKEGNNPIWDMVGYPGVDPHRPRTPSAAKLKSEEQLLRSVVDLSAFQGSSPVELKDMLARHGLRASLDDRKEREAPLCIECDAVVVGSGAGGGVAAAQLSQAGMKVVVLEKGSYVRAQDLAGLEKDGYDTMYERAGLMMGTDDNGLSIMAGSTVGGGTRVNWNVSFRTPNHVRQDWAAMGLPHFTSERYTASLDAVCSRLGVGTGTRHNKSNAALQRGLEALGVDVGEMPRNCRNSEACGHCPFGCATGDKQDTTATFLADAAAKGAKILTGVTAQRVLTVASSEGPRKQRALGVLVQLGSGASLAIRAPIVVASAGSLHTPALLLRSKITVNGNVGRHLHLHCGTAIACRFPVKDKAEDPEEGRMKLWEGAPMSVFSRECAEWGRSGYGPLVSVTSAHPGILAAASPWLDAIDFKQLVSKMPWIAVGCVYVRDKDSGSVTLDAEGQPRIKYWPSQHDQISIMKGVDLCCRAMIAAGAEEVITTLPGLEARFTPQRNADGSLANVHDLEVFAQHIYKQGCRKYQISLFSLHQMGSARLGASPLDSVADGEGECWDVGGLYVADASAFPTATGVNPMITAMSISHMVTGGIASRFKSTAASNGKAKVEVG